VKANSGRALAAAILLCCCIVGCGNSVKGHTYAGNDQLVKIEFQSDGKAYASTGPLTSTCTYTQNANKVTLICEGDTEELTLQSDGSLSGPPEGMLARLTRVK